MFALKVAILFFGPLLAGLLAFRVKNLEKKYIDLMLAFSGSYLLGITAIELIPHLFGHQHEAHGHVHFDYSVGLFILIGFLLQIVLDLFSKGVEHGHIHAHENPKKGFVVSITFGLCMHAFLEGIPLGSHQHFHDHSETLLAAIVLHKLPAAFALVSILFYSNIKKSAIYASLILFTLMSPLSMLLMELIEDGSIFQSIDEHTINNIFAIVVGSFLHISTTILFESSSKMHSFSPIKVASIVLGVLVAYLTV